VTKCRKGTIVAIVSGTASETVIAALQRIPEQMRARVKEITLDIADSMHIIVRRYFSNAIRVIDRSHVQK
jgi:transposase